HRVDGRDGRTSRGDARHLARRFSVPGDPRSRVLPAHHRHRHFADARPGLAAHLRVPGSAVAGPSADAQVNVRLARLYDASEAWFRDRHWITRVALAAALTVSVAAIMASVWYFMAPGDCPWTRQEA